MEIPTTDLNSYFNILNDVLNDSKHLQGLTKVKDAKDKLHQVKSIMYTLIFFLLFSIGKRMQYQLIMHPLILHLDLFHVLLRTELFPYSNVIKRSQPYFDDLETS